MNGYTGLNVSCGVCDVGTVDALGPEPTDHWECNTCGAIFETEDDALDGVES